MPEQAVRIFVSSPSDLDHERALVKDIVEQLAQEYLAYFKIRAVLWEEEALSAARSFQAGLLRPSECEIVLVMLWTRLGTPLAEDPYGGMTGTEWELVDAVQASEQGGRPEVLVYKKTAPHLVDITDAESTRAAVDDRQRLEAFFRAHFYNADGSFRRAFRQFDGDRALRALVEGQLRKLLNRRIGAELGLIAGAGEWRESPFRAGVPYALGDEPVFVGRETETRELATRLDRVKGPGRGLILVSGASGVGKSSLIRAGLLPRLIRPYLFAGIAGCRWCLLECTGRDPLGELARALMAPGLLGASLSGFGLDAAGLARLLARDPQVAAGQVRAALERADPDPDRSRRESDGRLQLAIVLDPLDALLGEPALADPATQRFAGALAALAVQDGVWVIATLRSDLLRALPRLPALAGLLDADTWYPLAPAPPGRIRQVMEIPARVARIALEDRQRDAGAGLVDLLESEASALEHWPPLLALTLDGLYRRAHDGADPGPTPDAGAGVGAAPPPGPPAPRPRPAAGRAVLTLEDYRRLGGLVGSALGRAEDLWQGQDPRTRAGLPRLCRALVSLEGGPGALPTPRAGDLRTLRRDPDSARLIDALIAARLAVAHGEPDPAEGLSCPDSAAGPLSVLARVARDTRDEWLARLLPRRSAELLARGTDAPGRSGPAGAASPGTLAPETAPAPGASAPGGPPPLARPADAAPAAPGAAIDWRDFRPVVAFAHPDLIRRWAPVRDWLADPDHRRDLKLRGQIGRQARLWKRTDCNREYLLGEVGYAGARRFADAFGEELEPLELDFLERSHRNLIDQRRRNRAVRLVGLTLAGLLAVATGAALWALDASRTATRSLHLSELNQAELAIAQGNTPQAVRLALSSAADLPQEATDTLSRAFAVNRLVAMVQGTGSPPGQPLPPAFRDDGRQLVTLSTRDGAILWNLDDERFVRGERLASPALPIHRVRFAGTGDRPLILGIGAGGVWMLPAGDGEPPDWRCGGRPGGAVGNDRMRRYLALSHAAPQGGFAVCMLDLARPGRPLWDQPLHAGEIRGLAFARDGMLLVTASRDGSARIVDTVTGFERLALPPDGPLDRPINRAIFDRLGQRVAIAGADERVRLYDLQGREQMVLGELERDGRRVRIHKSAVRDIAFDSGNRYLLAGDDEGQLVRWDLQSGDAVVLGQHRLSVETVRVNRHDNAGQSEPVVLTASLDKTARLWGLDTGKPIAVFSHDAAVSSARFSNDGRRVLTYSDLDGSARVWSVQPRSGLAFRLPHRDHVWHLDMAPAPKALDPDPQAMLIASGAFDGSVHVWRYDRAAPWAPPKEIWHLVGHRGRVRRVAFSPGARLLASAAFDGTARVWDMVTGGGCALEQDPEATEWASLYRVLFAPDGRWLLTASDSPAHPVRLWDPGACAALPLPAALEHGPSPVQAAAVATEAGGDQLAATGDATGTLRIARLDAGGDWSPVCRLQVHSAPIADLAFAPGGGLVATASEDGRAGLVAVPRGAGESCGPPRLLDGGTEALYSVRFAPDGAALVTAAIDARAQVWGIDGVRLADLVGHKDRVYHAELSPDGRWILTASRDGAVRIWARPPARAREDGEPPALGSYLVLAGDLGGAAYARFSPDGKGVGAAYWENAALLWRLWTEDPKPDPALDAVWGPDRARLALIREAARFRRDNPGE